MILLLDNYDPAKPRHPCDPQQAGVLPVSNAQEIWEVFRRLEGPPREAPPQGLQDRPRG